MRQVKFKRRTFHEGTHRIGDVAAFDEAVAANLVAVGQAEYVDAEPEEESDNGEADQGEATDPEKEGADEGTESEGSDDPEHGQDGEESLVCPFGCRDGEPFKSSAGFGSHLRSHNKD